MTKEIIITKQDWEDFFSLTIKINKQILSNCIYGGSQCERYYENGIYYEVYRGTSEERLKMFETAAENIEIWNERVINPFTQTIILKKPFIEFGRL